MKKPFLKAVRFFRKCSFSDTRKIMGKNFVSPMEVSKMTKLFYTEEQLKSLSKKLPSRKKLSSLKENDFFLIPLPSHSFCLKTLTYYFPCFLKNSEYWEKDYFFKHEKIDTGSWIAVSKDFGQKEDSLRVVEVLWLIIILKLTRNIDIAKDIFIETSSKTSSRIVPKNIVVGLMPVDGLILAIDDYDSKKVNFFKFK